MVRHLAHLLEAVILEPAASAIRKRMFLNWLRHMLLVDQSLVQDLDNGTGMLGGAGSPGGDELLTVTIQRDEHGYGMKVSGDNPVYVQSVKEAGAAWRAGLRAGDRIVRVGSVPVLHHTHQQVVHMIRANPTTVLTVQQNTSRHKTPITAPLPVNSEKQRQLEASKAHTVRLMLEQEQKFIRDLRNELSKVPDVRKQAQLESAESRCSVLQNEIDSLAAQPDAPSTPRPVARKQTDKPSPQTGFLSGLPRSLSNLTNQSIRNLRQRQSKEQPPLIRQNSDETNKRRHVHNNTVPLVPTTCLDNVSPPPLPPRSTERPKRTPISPLSPPINPLAKPKPCSSTANQYYKRTNEKAPQFPMHQSMPSYNDNAAKLRRSSHSLDGELDGPQPNSIALQMAYPLVNVPPPPLQTDNRGNVPVLHVRSQSSPEHLDHELTRPAAGPPAPSAVDKEAWARGTPPPGTPPPPYAHNTQPCADPQRAIISMEEDDSPASDNSTYSGLFSNLRSVRESKARTAVLLNWLLGERRCACASLLLIITDGYRSAAGVGSATLRRWAYEIQSTFLMPNAALQLTGVDEHMANEIERVLVNEYDKEELLRNVFRKARQKAKEELSQQLSEFQVKRQVGLGTLYGPADSVLDKCDVDKAQEQVVVERLMCQRLTGVAGGGSAPPRPGAGCTAPAGDAHQALLAALIAAALCLHCRPAAVAAAVGGQRASFLQRDKLYKQRTKQLAKMHPQPFVVRGHHLQLQALTSVGHCHHCENVIWGPAPQAYVCTDCKLRVHRQCARVVEEGCCMDGHHDHHNNRISRFMDRIHAPNQDSSDKKSRKTLGTAHFLNMERSVRKTEDFQPWDQTLTPNSVQERRDESDESLYESADCHSDAISASDDAIPRLDKTPTMSKESLKLAVTDEEVDGVVLRNKKTHRKTMSLSNPIEMVKNLGDDWFDSNKKSLDKHSDKKKSKESLWSEEDRESIHSSNVKLESRKSSKKEDKSQSNSRKSSTNEQPSRKSSKSSSVSALNFLRRKKTPTTTLKTVEAVAEAVDKIISTDELLNYTRHFLEEEKRYSAIRETRPPVETDSDEDLPTPKVTDHRRRLSRQTSRTKSKARGKSQSVKVNTLRKSHSGTLKKGKKKSVKTPAVGRSRQASVVEQTPILKKKSSDHFKQNSWLFSGYKGESKREGSTEDTAAAPEADVDTDTATKEPLDKDNNWRLGGSRGVNRAESCRERDAPRRGKHRNASDPNRLTALNHNDLEPGSATAPSGSSSSSSLSSRSNESNTVAADQHASASELSDEEEQLSAQWADSLPQHALDSLALNARQRKRQEVIHELIVSEGSHCRWLRCLSRMFLSPLETQPGLLPPDELRALFPNLPGVKERHCKLYADLRALRNQATNYYVEIGPVAEAMLSTLGDVGYATCLSRFCRGQRMALDALKERRRKNKELQQFLASREAMPLCGRLQLRDLLACVWQRLTKYQLLLESILKTVVEGEGDEEPDKPEDIATLRRALDVAKDVLHGVDTAIRTAENEHRLRSIQSKLEIRIPCSGSEWEDPKRLDLTQHVLRHEGDLHIRNDSNKKMTVLGLMLEDCLVLLQKESDKFILKPISQPSQQGMLSPLVKWDRVLFRANAAVRNAFFLMNINGVQMHELSCSTAAEYATWLRNIEELPLAKPELRPTLTPSHQPSRSTDDSGINVSRNPSDASEKSTSSAPDDHELERDRASVDNASERDRASVDNASERDKTSTERTEDQERERDDRKSLEKEETSEREERHKPRRPTVGRVCTHTADPCPPALEAAAALTVLPPAAAAAHTAHTAFTHQERLRRLDEGISRALRAKAAVVGELLGVAPQHFAQLAELAVADTLGQVDVCSELLGSRCSPEEARAAPPDVHQLLLAAQAQANQLTEMLGAALTVSEAGCVRSRLRPRTHCDSCRRAHSQGPDTHDYIELDPPPPPAAEVTDPAAPALPPREDDAALECDTSGAALASRLVGVSCGLQCALGRLLAAVAELQRDRGALRAELAALRDANDVLRAQRRATGFPATEEISYPKESVEQSMQDQPSNGG